MNRLLEELVEGGLIKGENFALDATSIKAARAGGSGHTAPWRRGRGTMSVRRLNRLTAS